MLLLYRRVKTACCSFGSSYKTSAKQWDLSLLATWRARHRHMQEVVRCACSYAHTACLLLRKVGSKAPAPGTVPGCLLPPQRHLWDGVMDIPQLLHVGLMGHCSSQRRLSLPTWCKQRQIKGKQRQLVTLPVPRSLIFLAAWPFATVQNFCYPKDQFYQGIRPLRIISLGREL